MTGGVAGTFANPELSRQWQRNDKVTRRSTRHTSHAVTDWDHFAWEEITGPRNLAVAPRGGKGIFTPLAGFI